MGNPAKSVEIQTITSYKLILYLCFILKTHDEL